MNCLRRFHRSLCLHCLDSALWRQRGYYAFIYDMALYIYELLSKKRDGRMDGVNCYEY